MITYSYSRIASRQLHYQEHNPPYLCWWIMVFQSLSLAIAHVTIFALTICTKSYKWWDLFNATSKSRNNVLLLWLVNISKFIFYFSYIFDCLHWDARDWLSQDNQPRQEPWCMFGYSCYGMSHQPFQEFLCCYVAHCRNLLYPFVYLLF